MVSYLLACVVIHTLNQLNNLTIKALGRGLHSFDYFLFLCSLSFPLFSTNGSYTCGNHLSSVHKTNKSFRLYFLFI